VLTTNVPCAIKCRAKDANEQITALMEQYAADAADPVSFKCLRCKDEGYDGPLSSWRHKVCSNCYSENVMIVKVRLGFENWGDQNGGEAQQRERYDRARSCRLELLPELRASAGVAMSTPESIPEVIELLNARIRKMREVAESNPEDGENWMRSAFHLMEVRSILEGKHTSGVFDDFGAPDSRGGQ